MTKLETIQKKYKSAIKRFEKALDRPHDEFLRDSCIVRFEFTFDLCWKFLKLYLEEKKGIVCPSPKECFREAYKQGIIAYEEVWLDITNWRNEAVHTYSEKFANGLYKKLPKVLEHFKKLEKVLQK